MLQQGVPYSYNDRIFLIAYIVRIINICYHKYMEELNFEFYTRPNGHTEFQEYLDSLSEKARAKLLARIYIISIKGIRVGIEHDWVKPLEKNLYEIRSRISNNQQRGLYFHVDGNHYIITHGFTKKSNKTPSKEINHAKNLREEYLSLINRKDN